MSPNKIPSSILDSTINVHGVGLFQARIAGNRAFLGPIPHKGPQPDLKPGQAVTIDSPPDAEGRRWNILAIAPQTLSTGYILEMELVPRHLQAGGIWIVSTYYHESPPEPKAPRDFAIETSHSSAASAATEIAAALRREDLGRIYLVRPDGTGLTWTRNAGQGWLAL